MIVAELIVQSKSIEWHIPSHQSHRLYTTDVEHTIPMSLLFNRESWTIQQRQLHHIRTKPHTDSQIVQVQPKSNTDRVVLHKELQKKQQHSNTNTRAQSALFYPTSEEQCAIHEISLTHPVEVDIMEDVGEHTDSKIDTNSNDNDSRGDSNDNNGSNDDEEETGANTEEKEKPTIACFAKTVPISVPTVSIIMTTYNCAKYIEFAIRSIQLQTLTNWELIIVDDRSTDNTDSLLRTMAHQDDRIIYLHNQCNLGCYASKNIAIQYASGLWLTFQDADDYSMSERLEKQLTFCVSPMQESDSTYDCCYVKSLSRKEKVWSWVPITMFISANVFRERLGAFDLVRFGADSEIRERMSVLDLRVGVFDDYLYACPDRWIETTSRQASLTGNQQHDPIRVKYKKAFVRFHAQARRTPVEMRNRRLKYTFDPTVDRPFEVDGLSAMDKDIFYPEKKNILQSMQLNAQMN